MLDVGMVILGHIQHLTHFLNLSPGDEITLLAGNFVTPLYALGKTQI